MSGRWMAAHLPAWPLQRHAAAQRRAGAPDPLAEPQRPFALSCEGGGGRAIAAANAAARRRGARASMRLADARAACPELEIAPADPNADRSALAALARWAERYTPKVAVDGEDGLIFDIAGCAHLFGGERRMLLDLERRLAAMGLVAKAAIGPKRAAVWAWARMGRILGDPPDQGVLPSEPEAFAAALSPLPIRALDLAEETARDLDRLGLRRIGDLVSMRKAPLLRRFEATLAERLNALFGDGEEPPIATAKEPAAYLVRASWAEPIATSEMVLRALDEALERLSVELEAHGLGARLLRLALHRLDGAAIEIEVGVSAPLRAPAHLARLLGHELDGIDLGFGVELMLLEAVRVQPFRASQAELAAIEAEAGGGDGAASARALEDLARLRARKEAKA